MKRVFIVTIALVAAATTACTGGTVSLSGGAGGTGSGVGGNAGSTTAQTSATQSTAVSGTSQSATSSSKAATAAATTGSGSMLDQARVICVNKINALRATKGLPAYNRWMSAETCVDKEATKDEQTMMPHGAWISGTYPCNGNGQNECLGAGVAGIAGCLDQMWNEKNQPNCSGCDACAGAYNPNCPNCDFYGKIGPECGHYVNMSAKYFTEAACGFSSLGGWDAINFQ